MEEIQKHRGHKDPHAQTQQHHHHLNLFHLPGHNHHGHKEQHQQSAATLQKYREVSSAIDEPTHSANGGNAAGSSCKLTVGRIV